MKRTLLIEEVEGGYVIRISEEKSGDFYETAQPEFVVTNRAEVAEATAKWLNRDTASIGPANEMASLLSGA